MKKKIWGTLLCAAMAANLLGGCAGAGAEKTSAESPADQKQEAASSQDTEPAGETGKKVKIRMTYWNSEDTVEELLKYLAEAVPEAEIEYQFIDNSNYDTIVDTQLSAGEGPDIICESSGLALKHARLGYLVPLNELGEQFLPSGVSVYTYNGDIYALPGTSWFEGIFYNKEIFAEHNIQLPTTFDEYISMCKQFQELGITPLAAGLKKGGPLMKNSMAFVTADYLSKDAGKNFGEEYREGKTTLAGSWDPYMEKWSEMITEGVYTQDMTGIDKDQALEQFAVGDAAMFCSGPWDLDTIMSKNPDLQIDMMPFHGSEADAGWLVGGPGCGFAANAASPNLEVVMKVLDAIASPEGQKAFWENNQGGSSYLKGVTFDLPDAYNSVADTLAAGNVYCPWDAWGVAASAHKVFETEMQSYFIGAQDLHTTLANVDQVVKELLEK
ncbi:MAG: extracellular solute-binding protein [Enterocloster asparagiformis]|nr:extracellular solute-binding protein [Enterocloster asparagiformis]